MKLWLHVRIYLAVGRALCHLDDCILSEIIGSKATLQGFVCVCFMGKKRPGLYAVL